MIANGGKTMKYSVCTHCKLLFLCFLLIVLILISFSSGSIIFERAIKIRLPELVLMVVVVMVVYVNLAVVTILTKTEFVKTD